MNQPPSADPPPGPPRTPGGGAAASFEGALLRGRYRVGQQVGKGGMATIYAATDTELGRKVVVKVPHVGLVDRDRFRERFELEVKGLVDTEHPHVVSILARGEHEGLPYFVIQFLKGGSLEDRIAERPMEPKAVAAWLGRIAEALDFIHGKGIIHRDVKPGNILFDEAGNVFLSDFGVAKAMGQDTSLTADGFTVGSPEYMAPEQISNEGLGPATDQYALGVTVYESLCRALPFTGRTALDFLIAKANKDPMPLREHGVAPEISDAVMPTLGRLPAQRYASCRAFAEAFEAAVSGGGTGGTGGRTPATPLRHTLGGSLDLTGQVLLGHYEVGGRLGSGGMGTVYQATDTDLGKSVVIKVPHPRLVAERGFLERFNREVTQLLRLEHPSIVRVLARGEVDGFPFYVLQHMKGGSLSDRLKAAPERRMPFEDVLAWFESTAKALDFLHSRGLIHRDVKPGNILFDEHDHAYLSDFGIAKAEEEDSNLTTTNTGVGSPRYMAPEQTGDKFDGRADQYALATTVYEAVTGRLPFPDGTAIEIMIRKMQEQPPAPHSFAPGLSEAASTALLRALAGRPEERYPTCRALFLAFKRGLRGESQGALPRPPVLTPVVPPGGAGPGAAPPTAAAPPGARGRGAPTPTRAAPRSPAPAAGAAAGAAPAAAPVAAPAAPPGTGPRTPTGRTRPAPGAAPAPAAGLGAPAGALGEEVRLWSPGFVLGFLGLWLLARLAPFARFALPHDLGARLGLGTGTDAEVLGWALLAPALVVGFGHGWLLGARGVTRWWTFAPATLIGAALGGILAWLALKALGDTLDLHPLGWALGACLGLPLGVCQWLALSPRLFLAWRWWVVTTLALAFAGLLGEAAGGGPRERYALVLGSGALVGAAQLLALRVMAPRSLTRGGAA